MKRKFILLLAIVSIFATLTACNQESTKDIPGAVISNPTENKDNKVDMADTTTSIEYDNLSIVSNALVDKYGKIDDLRKIEDFSAYSCYVDGKLFICSFLDAGYDSWYYYDIGLNKKILTSAMFGGAYVNEDGSLTAFIPMNPTITNEKDNIIFIDLPYTEDQYVTGFAPYANSYYAIYEKNGQLYYDMFDEAGNITETGVPAGSDNDKDFVELSTVKTAHNGRICTTIYGDCYFASLDMTTQEIDIELADGGYEQSYTHAISLSKMQGIIQDVDQVLNVVTTGKYVTRTNDNSHIYYFGNASLLTSDEPEWIIDLPEGKTTNEIVFFDGQILVFSDLSSYKVSSSFQEFAESYTITQAIQACGLENMIIDTKGSEVMFVLDGQIYELSGLY